MKASDDLVTAPAGEYSGAVSPQGLTPFAAARLKGAAGSKALWLMSMAVPLVDLVVLIAAVAASQTVAGSVDPAITIFGLLTLAGISVTSWDRGRLTRSAVQDSGRVLRSVCFSYAAVSAFLVLQGDTSGSPLLLATAAVAAPSLLVGRGVGHLIARGASAKGAKERAMVVGAGDIARRLVSTLTSHEEYGLQVIGAVDNDPKFRADELGTDLLGGIQDLPQLVRENDIDTVIVAFSTEALGSVIGILRATMDAGARVWVVPRFFELGFAGSGGDHIWGLPVVRLQPPARRRPAWVLKRAIDFTLAATGTLILSPVLGLIAALVWLDSGRPILHKQTRIGLDRKPFSILKFRTMRPDDKWVESTEWGTNATRVTRVGKILRKTGLDELPQLFNILNGDMSVVGPRPERPHFVELFSELYPGYDDRHRLPAGLTGWAQIHGLRGDTSIDERAVFDNYYIENWSVSEDLKIMVRTLPTFLRKHED